MTAQRRRHSGWTVIPFIVVCFAAGGIGSLFMGADTWTWYRGLTQPAVTPPGWLFGPVWSALYLMMGIAAWLVWRRGPAPGVGAALVLFAAQLVLNAIWTPVFFGLQNPGGALVIIGLLWLAIVATTVVFWRQSRAAGVLLIPYLLWVSFATYLNYSIATLNP